MQWGLSDCSSLGQSIAQHLKYYICLTAKSKANAERFGVIIVPPLCSLIRSGSDSGCSNDCQHMCASSRARALCPHTSVLGAVGDSALQAQDSTSSWVLGIWFLSSSGCWVPLPWPYGKCSYPKKQWIITVLDWVPSTYLYFSPPCEM